MAEQIPGAPRLHDALMRHTGFLISRIGMVAQKRFTERLESLGLTTRMWGALNVLDYEGAITQHALCGSVGMDPSSMVSTIDDLEAKGLVERRRHPNDRRAYALHVTDSGRETLARGRDLARQAQDDLLAPLAPDEREQLHALLLRLALASGDVGPPGRPAGTADAEPPGRATATDAADRPERASATTDAADRPERASATTDAADRPERASATTDAEPPRSATATEAEPALAPR